MAEDRHKHKPKSVRIPGGLLAWLADQAVIEGRKRNAVIVAALEEYRAAHGGEVAPSSVRGATTVQRGVTTHSDLQVPDCRHPADRVEAGECQDCGADVW